MLGFRGLKGFIEVLGDQNDCVLQNEQLALAPKLECDLESRVGQKGFSALDLKFIPTSFRLVHQS